MANGKPGMFMVVEKPADWKVDFPDLPVVSARDYLASPDFGKRGMKAINLCRSYGYLETGYYCSLLAEARRHRMLPAVRTLSDLTRKALYRLDAEEIDRSLNRYLKDHDTDHLVLRIFFGKTEAPKLAELARNIFEAFPCPLLQAEFRLQGQWKLQKLKAIGLHQLRADERELFGNSLMAYVGSRWRTPKQKESARYDMAILVNPDDPLPPSDEKALRKFEKAGKSLGIAIDRIGRKDIARLPEYDALFIRDTTRINHYTYRFSRQAESEGLVVIDDPQSILRCTNKVFLAELLQQQKIPHPKTRVVQQGQLDEAEAAIGSYPIVLKIPDGSFSKGVYKAGNRRELEDIAARLFKESDLILAQEYLYTDYDWRIGILDGKALYACQYFMSKNHWQIVDHKSSGGFTEGHYRTIPVDEAPAEVVDLALRAAKQMGNGLYGVDLKTNPNGAYVIEINDNPNLEAGVEDQVLGDALYTTILQSFIRRIDERRRA